MVDLRVRVRVCLKCKEYVSIDPVDPLNQLIVKEFENSHKCHMLSTLDFSEITNQYNNFLNEDLKPISERYENLINSRNS